MLVASPVTTNSPAASQPPWTATVDDIAVERYALQLEDNMPDKPAKISVNHIAFKAKDFSTAGAAPITMDVAMNLGESGRFAAKREPSDLQPPSAELDLQLGGDGLAPASSPTSSSRPNWPSLAACSVSRATPPTIPRRVCQWPPSWATSA